MQLNLSLFPLLAWSLAGFLGGVHCLAMCGGLAAALGLNIKAGGRYRMLFAANLGRIASYVLIGLLLGGLSGTVGWLPHAASIQVVLYLISLALVFLLGCYLAGWSSALTKLERLGGPLWRKLQPRFSALLPLSSVPAALAAGALWGWLPCGLVYTAAVGALASGSALQGGMILLAFGLGTLPNLMAMGLAASRLNRWRQHDMVRKAAGLLLASYAVLELGYWLWNQV